MDYFTNSSIEVELILLFQIIHNYFWTISNISDGTIGNNIMY